MTVAAAAAIQADSPRRNQIAAEAGTAEKSKAGMQAKRAHRRGPPRTALKMTGEGSNKASRIIVRFTGMPPPTEERMEPKAMRDAVNTALHEWKGGTEQQVCGAEFTKRGNIAVSSMEPEAADWLMERAEGFADRISHGRQVEVEPDETWQRIVVGGLEWDEIWHPLRGFQMEKLRDELHKMHPELAKRIRVMRPLCTESELYAHWRRCQKEGPAGRRKVLSVMVAGEEVVQVIRDGPAVYAWGRKCTEYQSGGG
jgi:hypothetical protein